MPSDTGLRPGSRLGPYEIATLLGAGGMGEVWRARDARLDRLVALKVLAAAVAGDPERLERFEREAKALAALNHPNIVTIHSVEEAEGVRFLTMELVDGPTLDRLIPPGGMAFERFLGIAIPLAEALAAAHERGVLHRDLKPANVMVTAGGRVKVLDFGLAKLAGVPGGEPTRESTGGFDELSREGQVLGTTSYMSPEQVQGRPADARSDVFSLGVVLYQMATGRRPFEGASPAEIISSILRDEPTSTSDLRPELPRQLGRILRHCLAKDPEHRFQSAKDLRNELQALRQEISEGQPIGSVSGERRRQVRPAFLKRAVGVGLAAALLGAGALLLLPHRAPPPPTEPAYARTALAVLPFRSLSVDEDYAYFAGGLHEEILTQLSRVAGLSLRGRISVMGYEGTTKSMFQIAEELAVGALLEGSVQVAGGRLRVSVQLIDTATDEHLWAETYDRTLDDAFAIQSEVAQNVVGAVGLALGSGERRAMSEMPTADPEAYRLYLQGLDFHRRPGFRRQNWEIAEQLFGRALDLDPEFALAHAALSEVHGDLFWYRYDPSSARTSAQREAAEEALRLAPNLPQAHRAMGLWHYVDRRDWSAALARYQIALQGLPNDAGLVAFIGYAQRRLGNWDEAHLAFERAAELDPRDAEVFADLGGISYRGTRRYADAVQAFDQALALAPDLHWVAVEKGWTYVEWQGQFDTLRAALDGVPVGADGTWPGSTARQRAEMLLWERDAAGLLEHLQSIGPDVLEGQIFFLPKSLYTAWAHQLRGDRAGAPLAFAAAREALDSVPPDLQGDWRVRAARGLAFAGLGQREEALDEARWLERSAVYREDAVWGTLLARNRAWILAQAGEAESALDELERLLRVASSLSAHSLRLDPRWDPIRAHPRFQALLTADAARRD